MKTKAEIARAITEKAIEQKKVDRINRHNKLVNKVVDRTIPLIARLGRESYRLKVKRKFSTLLLKEQFEAKGFTVTESMNKGNHILTIKW